MIYYFLRKKFDHTVRKKFGGKEVQKASSKKVRWAKLLCQIFDRQSSKKLRWKKKVQKASSRKVQEAKLLRQSSTTKFEKSSVDKKVQKAGSRKVRGAKLLRQSSTTKFEKSSVEKKVQNAGSRKVRWANKPGQQGSKIVRLQRGCTNRIRKIFKQRRRLRKKFNHNDPAIQEAHPKCHLDFFRNPSLPAIFWQTFSETRFKRFLRVWSSTICFALA